MRPPIDPPAISTGDEPPHPTNSTVTKRSTVSPTFSRSWIMTSSGGVHEEHRVAIGIVPDQVAAIVETLQSPTAGDDGPEVGTGMRMERSPLAGLQRDVPNPDPLVLETERRPHIQVARRFGQFPLELGWVEPPLIDDGHSLTSLCRSVPGTARSQR